MGNYFSNKIKMVHKSVDSIKQFALKSFDFVMKWITSNNSFFFNWWCYPVTIILLFVMISSSISSMDLMKSYEINEDNCRIVDGPRGFEDQTKWNKNVLLSS